MVAALLLAGCAQTAEEGLLPDKGQPIGGGIAVKGDRVAFATIDGYRAFLEAQDSAQRAGLVAELGRAERFTPLAALIRSERESPNGRVAAEDLELENTILAELLNADGILEIGEHLFKVEPSLGRVLALPKAREQASYQALLQGVVDNPDLIVFSTDDDVLDMIENGELPASAWYRAQFTNLYWEATTRWFEVKRGY